MKKMRLIKLSGWLSAFFLIYLVHIKLSDLVILFSIILLLILISACTYFCAYCNRFDEYPEIFNDLIDEELKPDETPLRDC